MNAVDGGLLARGPMRGEVILKKLLSFNLGKDIYAVDILTVQEIIRMMEVTAIPKTMDYIRGVINLRGEIIAVIDLRRRFGLPCLEDTDRACIIVLHVVSSDGAPVRRGIIVDGVTDVLTIPEDRIEAPPSVGLAAEDDFIHSIGRLDEQVAMILDVDKTICAALNPLAEMPA